VFRGNDVSYFLALAGVVNPGLAAVGLVTALVATWRGHRRLLVVAGGVTSIAWGLWVAGLTLRAGVGPFVVGALRAVPSYAVGVMMGLCVRHVVIGTVSSTGRRLA
jgi:hypothetical protein